MAFLTLTIVILFLLSFWPVCETKFIEIKSIGSDDYLVIFDTGFFIYDNVLNLKETLFNFPSKIDDIDNIIIIKHIFNSHIYIFCLIPNN